MIWKIFENILNSLDSIVANKMRAWLSMLWIIIWVSSVIILWAIGNWSTQAIVSEIEELWTNMLTLSAGSGRGSTRERATADDILNKSLVTAIKDNLDWLAWVLPTITGNGSAVYKSSDLSVSMIGVDQNYFTTQSLDLTYWVSISEEHMNALDKVAVIGQTVASDLFGWVSPIWEKMKIGKNIFTVIWIIEENSQYDSSVFIPLSTASIRIMWQKYYSSIIIFVEDTDKVIEKEAELDTFLQSYLNVTNPNSLPYNIRNVSELLERVNSITGTMTLLLSWIAGISLLVGWIWVMNIMLVSVTERTKEIGIRKAIWAWKSDILLQFLTEALSLSVIGWTIGIWFSYAVVFILNYFSIAAIIWIDSVIISFCFSLFIWLVFWILPAYKAAKLRPIDALRFE